MSSQQSVVSGHRSLSSRGRKTVAIF